METNNQNNNSGINFNLIIIVALVCATALIGFLFMGGSKSGQSTGFGIMKSEVPVYISWRETMLPGHTQVAQIWPKNGAKLPLRLTLEIEVSSTGNKLHQEILVDTYHTAKEPLEIGFLEGYQFVPGDRLTLSHKDFSSIESTCQSK
jgi:hypothetical protein